VHCKAVAQAFQPNWFGWKTMLAVKCKPSNYAERINERDHGRASRVHKSWARALHGRWERAILR
jgi:hypothetical protein